MKFTSKFVLLLSTVLIAFSAHQPLLHAKVPISSASSVAHNSTEIKSLINEAIENLDSVVTFKGPYSSINQYKDVLTDLPGVSSYNLSLTSSNNGNQVTVNLNYKQAYKISRTISNPSLANRLDKSDRELYSFAQSIISKIITPDMTPYEKELTIHDYIVNNASYDYVNLQRNTLPDSAYTAAGILFEKSGVCQGYSEAFKLLLDLVGIENQIVIGSSSTSAAHAWNIVRIDNDWYMVDLTYDDPILEQDGKRVEVLSHEYFNVTDSMLQKDHTWISSNYPSATGTKFNYYVINKNLVNSYSEFKNYIISQIKAGKKEINCYITNYDASKYDLSFIHKYYPNSYLYSTPNSSSGVFTLTLK